MTRHTGPTGDRKELVCKWKELLCRMPPLIPFTPVGWETRGQSLSSTGLGLKKDLGV